MSSRSWERLPKPWQPDQATRSATSAIGSRVLRVAQIIPAGAAPGGYLSNQVAEH
jgi:hypothetical protein